MSEGVIEYATPVAFGYARLAEEESSLHLAGPGQIAWLTYRDDQGQLRYTTVASGNLGVDDSWCFNGDELPPPASVRVVHDQARELRDIERKRTLLAEHDPDLYGCTVCREDRPNDELWRLCTTARLLIARWDDHPDYDEAWKP